MAGKSYIADKKVVSELKAIYDRSKDGILTPERVVDAARSPKSALHNHFEWDDSIAAQRYRIEQAREILRITVEYLPQAPDKPTRVFMSLSSDRTAGGYRTTVDVMNDCDMRAQLLKDALDELKCIQKKYADIKELSGVFSAINKARKKVA